jgi:hypothetical protein
MEMLEMEMRSALGLQKYKKAKPASVNGTRWRIEMSVRKKSHGAASGLVLKLEYTASCIGEFDAEMRARKFAAQEGFVVWAITGFHKL